MFAGICPQQSFPLSVVTVRVSFYFRHQSRSLAPLFSWLPVTHMFTWTRSPPPLHLGALGTGGQEIASRQIAVSLHESDAIPYPSGCINLLPGRDGTRE